jgi:hypothetical protein
MMEKQPQILLIGDSVLIDSLGEKLNGRADSQIVRKCSTTVEAQKTVNIFIPDLVIYELNAKNADSIFSMLRSQADTMHLVLDLDSKQVILLESQRKPTGSMQELCDLVNQIVI